ncbi:DUF6011 domain-containing protein [Mycolicibacterium fortuitum]|jgi:rubredoxin|uniref:DUF6011 domain-containing protein n=1 Tax=Mycolicibacterium fortuitum TaxID=1766 RepID=UPI000B2F0E97|nr:DUF6011 domain-containing protein [Mycolicibacterium fortuitum]
MRSNDAGAARTDRGAGTPLDEIRIAVRCNNCGHWLTDPESVALGIGPRCRDGADG